MRITVDGRQWLRLVRRAYRRASVLALGVVGMGCLVTAGVSSGYWQGLFVNVGTALLLVPPIVVTERLALEIEVAALRDSFRRVGTAQELSREQSASLEDQFNPPDYSISDLLSLAKECSKRHAISKWGIAVPLTVSDPSIMLGIRLTRSDEPSMSDYLPDYAIEASESLSVKLLAPGEAPD